MNTDLSGSRGHSFSMMQNLFSAPGLLSARVSLSRSRSLASRHPTGTRARTPFRSPLLGPVVPPGTRGDQAPEAWQVDEGRDELSWDAAGTLPSPQAASPPCGAWMSAASLALGVLSAKLSGPDFPCLPFPCYTSVGRWLRPGPRKCQSASWEHGPPAGEQAAPCSFLFGAALPISLYSAHMPGAEREAGQAEAKLDNGLPEHRGGSSTCCSLDSGPLLGAELEKEGRAGGRGRAVHLLQEVPPPRSRWGSGGDNSEKGLRKGQALGLESPRAQAVLALNTWGPLLGHSCGSSIFVSRTVSRPCRPLRSYVRGSRCGG